LARQADGSVLQPIITYRLVLDPAIPAADAHRILRAAAAAHPTDFLVQYAAGYRLATDAAEVDWENRVRLLDEAIGYFRAAIAVRPRYANTWYDLGSALIVKEDWAGAEAALRTALRLYPEPSDTHVQLGIALAGQRRYGEALRVMRAALTGTPIWVSDPGNHVRYNSACFAARCGTGQGVDIPPPAGWSALRKEALGWLTADLAGWEKRLRTTIREFRLSDEVVHAQMEYWLADPDLSGVRHPLALGLLPADEAAGWRKLWADVRDLRDRTAPRELAPPPRPGKLPG
jgi:tetratricopeptide (TPR) repeat protein